jgi:hypothetical protein
MFKQILIAFDQLLNTFLGGYADETLSARAWRTEQSGKIFGKIFRPLIDVIFFFDPQHCFNSYLSEKQRKQYPNYYRD